MPHVVNGCGTWYYGKKNLQRYVGVCRACGNETTLTSYDTRLYVVVVFIPVIPLRARHIIEECAMCTRHAAMPLAEWKTAQKRTDDAIAAYRRSPHNPELAREALAAAASHRNLPALMSVAPDVEKGLPADAETMRVVAAAYETFNRTPDAERALRTALSSDPDSHDTREMLAECLLRQGKPQEAEQYLSHVVEEGIPDRIDLLYRLGQGYQMKGEHEKALAVFDQCEAIFPDIARDQTYQRLRGESTRRRGSKIAVKPGEVERQAKSAASRKKALRAVPVVVAVAALAYAALCFIVGTRRSVYLVNGLGRAYTARINGTEYTLQPATPTRVRVSEGDVKVEMSDAPPPLASTTVRLHTPFLTRPFSGATFVLNPDRTAVIERQRTYYTPRSSSGLGNGPEGEDSLHVGKVLHRFDDINYVFEPFPRTLHLESGSGQVSRQRVALADDRKLPAPMVLMIAARDSGPAAVVEAAKIHLAMEPERGEFLAVLHQTMEPAELASFLRTGLEARPIRVQWHRSYQESMARARQEAQLEGEYAALLARDPQNKDLMYLAARAIKGDNDRSLAMLRQAAAGPDPSGYATFSLCAYHLCNGDFPASADLAEKTLKLLPEVPEVKFYAKQALLADKRYDRLLELLRAEHNGPMPTMLAAYGDEVYVHTARGDRAAADLAVQALRAELKDFDKESAERQVMRVEALRAYVGGDPARWAQALATSDDEDDVLAAQLTICDLDAAEQTFQKTRPNAHTQLLMYLAARKGEKNDLAEKHLKGAIELLAKGDYEDQVFARALDGKPDRPIEQLLRTRGQATNKATLLVALGMRDEKAREQCFALARKLNFDKRYPHLLLAESMGDRAPENSGAEKAR